MLFPPNLFTTTSAKVTVTNMGAKCGIGGYSRNVQQPPKQEKRVTLDPSLLKLENFMDWASDEYINNLYFPSRSIFSPSKLQVGVEYALEPNNDIDGLGIYKVVHVIEEKEDSYLSGVVVKEVSDVMNEYTKYTLTEEDCAYLGIDYEEGLLLYPSNLPWKIVNYTITNFDPNDLSTVQFCNKDKKIHTILLSVKGFENYGAKGLYTKSPNNMLVPREQLMSSIKVKSKKTMRTSDSHYIEEGELIDNTLFRNNTRFIPNRVCTMDTNEILVQLHFPHGIDNDKLQGISPNELFEISWDEFGCLTVEEHEKLKAQKEAEAKKRAEEESERAKQLKLDADKRKANLKKSIEAARKSANGFTAPKPPKDFNALFSEFESYQAKVNMITNGVDEMVNNIMESLEMPTMPKFKLKFVKE